MMENPVDVTRYRQKIPSVPVIFFLEHVFVDY